MQCCDLKVAENTRVLKKEKAEEAKKKQKKGGEGGRRSSSAGIRIVGFFKLPICQSNVHRNVHMGCTQDGNVCLSLQ